MKTEDKLFQFVSKPLGNCHSVSIHSLWGMPGNAFKAFGECIHSVSIHTCTVRVHMYCTCTYVLSHTDLLSSLLTYHIPSLFPPSSFSSSLSPPSLSPHLPPSLPPPLPVLFYLPPPLLLPPSLLPPPSLTFFVTMNDTTPPWSMIFFFRATFFLKGREESMSRTTWHSDRIPILSAPTTTPELQR